MHSSVNLCFALMCIVLVSANNVEAEKEESALSRVWNYFSLGSLGRKGEASPPGQQNFYPQMYPQFGPCAMPSTTTTTTPAPAIPLCPYPFVSQPMPQPLPLVGHETAGFPIPGPPFQNQFPNGLQGQEINPMFPNQFRPQPPISDLTGGNSQRPNPSSGFDFQGNQPRPFNPSKPYNPQDPFFNQRPQPLPFTPVESNKGPTAGVLRPEITNPNPHGITVVDTPVIGPVGPDSPQIVNPIQGNPDRPIAVRPSEIDLESPVKVKPIQDNPEKPIAIKPITGHPERPEKIPPISPETPVAVRPNKHTADEPELINPNRPQPLRPDETVGVIPLHPMFPLPANGDQFGAPYGPHFGNQLGPIGPRPLGPSGPDGGPQFGPYGQINIGPRPPVDFKPFNPNAVDFKPFNPNGGTGRPPFLPIHGPDDDQFGPNEWNGPFRPDGDNQILAERPFGPGRPNIVGGPDNGNLFDVEPFGPHNGKPPRPISDNQIGPKPYNPNGDNYGPNVGPNGGPSNRPHGALPFPPNVLVPVGPNVVPSRPDGELPTGPNGGLPFQPNGVGPIRPDGGNRPNGLNPFRPEENERPRPNKPLPSIQDKPTKGKCDSLSMIFVPPGFSVVKNVLPTCGIDQGPPPCSMLEMLQRLRLRTFLTLIRLAGLEQMFIDEPFFTLFVPVDVAFELLPRWFLESLIADKTLLQNFLFTHFIQSDVPLSSLGNEYRIKNRRPGSHRLRVTIAFPDLDYPTIMIDAAKVLKGDIMTTNGRLNIIDKVLKPNPPKDAIQYLKEVEALKNFVSVIEAAKLVPLLEGEDPLTIFVPHNRGFNESEVAELSENKVALQNFCKYHMVNGSYYSAGLQNGQYLTTNYLKEIKIGIATDGFAKYLNVINGHIRILKSDITTTNAVIHIIEEEISSAAPFYTLEGSNEFGFEFEILRRNMNLSPEETKDEASSN